MTINADRASYERRLAVVEQLVRSRGLQSSNISTLAFSEEYQYPFNNYLFKVELALPASPSSFPGTQPGTTEAPSDGVSALVIKLSNLAVEGLNNANRVENDVAVQHLVRQSMVQAGLGPLVPAIYAWAPAKTTDATDETGFGWIMSELKSGVDLDSEFSSLGLEDKDKVLDQIAAVLRAIQTARLPESVTKFGGLTFDSSGRIVSGEAPLQKGEPVGSYAEWKVRKLRTQLKKAAESPVILGWKSSGLDTRIEKFLTGGGPEKALTGVDLHRKSLIHADFTTNNMLFDKDSKKITAVLDFDWSFVSNPLDEFMSGLSDVGGHVGDEDNEIDTAILSGDFTRLPADLDEESTKKWEAAKAWNTAMRKGGVVSPGDIEGVDKIRDFGRLQTLLCPYRLGNASALEQLDDEKRGELRAKTEADLVQWLEKHGF
ncbi:hypothetical protein G6O67_000494 [Ophiocordyceps sinensis]|uniref:non-specific serine/threonine protein kinase n=2 Tax=Ophiocordyceps sinensis TaxID=72228 RepID=A0A8H4PZ67_9HYPO|nr:Protein kinase-like domain protein [Ophiocordyceps sinensis CO18]KAF4513192.1 hypothetical protein G6O67_000494 [Ophiocordyceps sinensis]